jgi:cardiolipin synthase
MSMFGIVLVLLFVWWAAVIAYHSFKHLPPGLSMEGDVHRVDAVDFLYDLTYRSEGQIVREQMILPRILQRIEEAREWILLDMFLFNGYHDPGEPWEPVSEMLAGKLIEKKQKNPDIRIYCIVDEVNTSYGAHRNELLDTLRAHGCEVMIADVDRLRDSIPIYSSIWRMFFRWFGQKGHGWIRNPLALMHPT